MPGSALRARRRLVAVVGRVVGGERRPLHPPTAIRQVFKDGNASLLDNLASLATPGAVWIDIVGRDFLENRALVPFFDSPPPTRSAVSSGPTTQPGLSPRTVGRLK